ncbi:MAG: hypothetical protein ACT4PY_12735 [Armatimonadota bacterium]
MKKLIKVTRKGDAYCFDSAIARENVVIASGRCYTFYHRRHAATAVGAGGDSRG